MISIFIIAALGISNSQPVPVCGEDFAVFFEIVGGSAPYDTPSVLAVFDGTPAPVSVHQDLQNPQRWLAIISVPTLSSPSNPPYLDVVLMYQDALTWASYEGKCP